MIVHILKYSNLSYKIFNDCNMRIRPIFILIVSIAFFVDLNGFSQELSSHSGITDAKIQYITTARQFGPVAYRAPLGVISPDGNWLAYTSGPYLYIQRIVGGPIRKLTRAESIRHIVWGNHSRTINVHETNFSGETNWFIYNLTDGSRKLLWQDKQLHQFEKEGIQFKTTTAALQQLSWSTDGKFIVGIVQQELDFQIWTFYNDGNVQDVQSYQQRLSFPTFLAEDESIAFLSFDGVNQVIQFSSAEAGGTSVAGQAYGPFALAPGENKLYYAAPKKQGTLDLWHSRLDGTSPKRITNFDKDTYAPSISHNGDILFKTQDYWTSIAIVPSSGGKTKAVTTFQSETPSWSWDSEQIAFTFGPWRSVLDDFHYPDIAQHIGIVNFDENRVASEPHIVVRKSYSEDQGMHWSPNNKWIVFHTHADGTDDLWLHMVDGSQPDQPLTHDGHETGWPRWSPDGKQIAYSTQIETKHGKRSALFLIGVNQQTGEVNEQQREIELQFEAHRTAVAEWSYDSENLIFESVISPGKHGIFVVSRTGQNLMKIHEFESDQIYSGASVSPDFRWVVFIKPATDGFFQLFRVPISGGSEEQLTFDPIDKTQPAYSPDGKWIAFSVFSFKAHFWLLQGSNL